MKFTLEMLGCFNIQQSLNIFYHINNYVYKTYSYVNNVVIYDYFGGYTINNRNWHLFFLVVKTIEKLRKEPPQSEKEQL